MLHQADYRSFEGTFQKIAIMKTKNFGTFVSSLILSVCAFGFLTEHYLEAR